MPVRPGRGHRPGRLRRRALPPCPIVASGRVVWRTMARRRLKSARGGRQQHPCSREQWAPRATGVPLPRMAAAERRGWPAAASAAAVGSPRRTQTSRIFTIGQLPKPQRNYFGSSIRRDSFSLQRTTRLTRHFHLQEGSDQCHEAAGL